MTLTLTAIILFVGFAFLIKGADILVSNASVIASKKHISPLIIGVLLVGFGTSAPELFFNIISALRGHTDFALSNVSGSNLANISLGLAISAILVPLPINIRHYIGDLLFFLTASLLGFVVIVLIYYSSVPQFAYATFLLLVVVLYIVRNLYLWNKPHTPLTLSPFAATNSTRCTREWFLVILGLVSLYCGGELVLLGALKLTSVLHVSESVVGLTVVAAGTSLPDCTATIMSAIRRENQIAVGNILGSNIFNILLVLPSTIIASSINITSTLADCIDYGSGLALTVVICVSIMMRQHISRSLGLAILLAYIAFMIVRLRYVG
jgi:cation:H+ antiporter